MLGAAILYLLTLDNGLRPDELTGGDLITHQYAQVQARPSNAPGYPLYTMGGWLWFRLGRILLGWTLNPIQVLSFYSTLWGLAALVVLYLILVDLNKLWARAALLTAFYATTFFFWYYSVTTEQYTSAVFQTLLIIWLAFKWDTQPRDSLVLWLAFISGTMLANMVTALFILPPLLWFIFFKKSENGFAVAGYLKRPGFIFKAVGLALLPVLAYAYIYIRGAQHPEWRGEGQWPTTWAWFIQFITIQQGRDELAPGLSLQTIFTNEFPALMGWELTWVIFWGGLIGLAFLGRRRAIFLYSTLVIYLFFSWGYRFGNWFQVIIPAYPVFIIGVAAGLQRLDDWRMMNDERKNSRFHQFINAAIIVFLIGLVFYRFTTNFPQANQRHRPADTGLVPGWAIVADNPNVPARIIATFEERVALDYLTQIWGVYSDLTPVDAASKSSASASDTFYISRQAAAAAPNIVQTEGIYPQAAGEQLIALSPTPLTQLPPAATPSRLNFGDALQLAGWEWLEPDSTFPANSAKWQLALYWQTSDKMDTNYTISVRPLVDGQLIMQDGSPLIQDHQPVWGVYPTSRWPPNQIVKDVYALNLPVTPDAVQIIVYHAAGGGFENLGEQTLTLFK